jgi:hypothetical protein
MHVPSGSYVFPADVVSAHGEGNTIAGFKVLRRVFGGTPYGGGKSPYGQSAGPYGEPLATGGHVDDESSEGVPIVAAGGEMVITPEQVARVGDGDMELGHRVLDEFVKRSRANNVKELKTMPPPRRD